MRRLAWALVLSARSVESAPRASACRSVCSACAAAYDPHPRPTLPPLPPFYLHEEGAFNFSDVSAAVQRLLGDASPDDVLPVDSAEHFVEYHLLQGLRGHPARTHVADAAQVHVLGVMPFTSWVVAELGLGGLGDLGGLGGPGGLGGLDGHTRRMHGVAQALRASRHWQASPAGWQASPAGPPFLLVVGHYSFLRDLTEPLATELSRPDRRAMLAVTDPAHGRYTHVPAGAAPGLRGLIGWAFPVPYVAHAGASAQGTGATRHGVMFHGGIARRHGGREVRRLLVRLLGGLRAMNESVDLRISEFAVPARTKAERLTDARRASYSASGLAYHNATLCPVPAGDTPNSRRLFDAMAAGCAPLLLRQPTRVPRNATGHAEGRDTARRTFYADLPFPHSIDWRAATLCLVPTGACVHRDAEWIQGWMHDLALDNMRAHARNAFRQHLDYANNPRGVASALLRKAAALTPPRPDGVQRKASDTRVGPQPA